MLRSLQQMWRREGFREYSRTQLPSPSRLLQERESGKKFKGINWMISDMFNSHVIRNANSCAIDRFRQLPYSVLKKHYEKKWWWLNELFRRLSKWTLKAIQRWYFSQILFGYRGSSCNKIAMGHFFGSPYTQFDIAAKYMQLCLLCFCIILWSTSHKSIKFNIWNLIMNFKLFLSNYWDTGCLF